jgi:hypothetical protein
MLTAYYVHFLHTVFTTIFLKALSCKFNLNDGHVKQVAGSCEHGNEPSGSIKCGEFLD